MNLPIIYIYLNLADLRLQKLDTNTVTISAFYCQLKVLSAFIDFLCVNKFFSIYSQF